MNTSKEPVLTVEPVQKVTVKKPEQLALEKEKMESLEELVEEGEVGVDNNPYLKLMHTKSRMEGNELIYTKVYKNEGGNVFNYVYKCSGDIKDRKLNGKGKKCYFDDTYEGEFRNNKLHGHGKKSTNRIYVYEGMFENDMLNGQGSLTVRQGAEVYKGEFKNDKLNGKGEIFCNDGQRWKGNFKDNKLSGPEGMKKDIWGNTYVGEFENDMLNGEGIFTMPDRAIFIGKFKDNKLHGQGKITSKWIEGDKKKETVVEGLFENGDLKKGKIVNKTNDVDVRTDEGTFLKGQLMAGTITYKDRVEEGEFKDGQLIHGKITYSDGRVEELH